MLAIVLGSMFSIIFFAAVCALVKPHLEAQIPKNPMGFQFHKLASQMATIGTHITVWIFLPFYLLYQRIQIIVLSLKIFKLRRKGRKLGRTNCKVIFEYRNLLLEYQSLLFEKRNMLLLHNSGAMLDKEAIE